MENWLLALRPLWAILQTVLLLWRDLPVTTNRVRELEAFGPSSGPVLDHTGQPTQEDADTILAAVKPNTCILDLCPLRLVKVCGNGMQTPLRETVNFPSHWGFFWWG